MAVSYPFFEPSCSKTDFVHQSCPQPHTSEEDDKVWDAVKFTLKHRKESERKLFQDFQQRIKSENIKLKCISTDFVLACVENLEEESIDATVESWKLHKTSNCECEAHANQTSTSIKLVKSSEAINTAGILTDLLCKVCLDQKVNALLFPCSHLVTCTSCTTALFTCPVCRSNIKGTITITF